MWAIAKTYREGDRLFYTGIKSDWTNQASAAARWCDRRDAWRCITANDWVGKAETVFFFTGNKADPNQYVVDEVMFNAPSANNM